jgi:hypothetical protein
MLRITGYIRSCWVGGVRDVVAPAKICGMLEGCAFLTRAVVSASAVGAAKADAALSAKVAKTAMDLKNNMVLEQERFVGCRLER